MPALQDACFSFPCLHDYLPDTLLPDTLHQGQKFPLLIHDLVQGFSFFFFILPSCQLQQICIQR